MKKFILITIALLGISGCTSMEGQNSYSTIPTSALIYDTVIANTIYNPANFNTPYTLNNSFSSFLRPRIATQNTKSRTSKKGNSSTNTVQNTKSRSNITSNGNNGFTRTSESFTNSHSVTNSYEKSSTKSVSTGFIF